MALSDMDELRAQLLATDTKSNVQTATSDAAVAGFVVAGASKTALDAAYPAKGAAIQFTSGALLSSGAGVPGIAATAGDFYLRTGAPATGVSRIYVYTVTGGAGAATWVGIV
jgi:hypothetical protein